jgi:hypothetical protein
MVNHGDLLNTLVISRWWIDHTNINLFLWDTDGWFFFWGAIHHRSVLNWASSRAKFRRWLPTFSWAWLQLDISARAWGFDLVSLLGAKIGLNRCPIFGRHSSLAYSRLPHKQLVVIYLLFFKF